MVSLMDILKSPFTITGPLNDTTIQYLLPYPMLFNDAVLSHEPNNDKPQTFILKTSIDSDSEITLVLEKLKLMQIQPSLALAELGKIFKATRLCLEAFSI